MNLRFYRASLVALCLALDLFSVSSSVASPTVVSVTPPPGATVSNLSQVTVTFSVPVTSVQAADLLANDLPATARTGSGSTHTFLFNQPAPGSILVYFDSDTIITDLSGNSFDPFAPEASWTYKLADTIPPVVQTATPSPGAAITSLTRVEVVFSEPVSGVDAADLVVNGQPATSLTPLAADRYLFEFPQPADGTVSITWTGGHGIQDLAPAPNNFGGTGWSYILSPAAGPDDVVINEILADNLNSLADEDKQKQDWIELRNRGANSVNLLGWSLTDDPGQPGKWTFPALTLGPGQYKIVYASGKDRKTTAANATNHTNFRLNIAGNYLALFRPELPRTAAQESSPAYPEQRSDVSYGLTAAGALAYFSAPTPGSANNEASAIDGFAQPPHASVRSGFFDRPFDLVLTTETPGAQIRYTLDGSAPTIASPPWSGPTSIAGTPSKAVVIVRAATFKTGLVPSSVTSHTYIFPDHVLTQPANPEGFPTVWDSPCTTGGNCVDTSGDYEMDPQVITNTAAGYAVMARQGLVSIPTVSVVTHSNLLFGPAQGVYVRREDFNQQPVHVEYILPDGGQGFSQDCGMEIQGQTSPTDSGGNWKSKKLSLRLIFKGEFGPTDLRYKVFEDSPVEEFDTLILSAGHNLYWNYMPNDEQRRTATYVRDQFAANLQNRMGGLSHHGRFVHLYLNGLYWGLHQLHERPDDSFAASYLGGDKSNYDVIKHGIGTIVAGSSATLSTAFSIARSGLASNTTYENLQQYLNVPDFVDYMIVNFWIGNSDWAHKNYYASHRRQPPGLWRYHAWDSEHVLKSVSQNSVTFNNSGGPTELFQLLRNNAEFRLLFADHVHKHFFQGGLFDTDTNNPIYNPAFPERNRPAALFMTMMQEIDTAIVCESARWGDVGSTRLNNPCTRNVEWLNERDALLGVRNTSGHTWNFFPQRTRTVLGQLRAVGVYPANLPPAFSQQGGPVPVGHLLYLTNLSPGAVIHYTTNGVDPRVYGSGAVSTHARVYTGTPISLDGTMVVKARSLLGGSWSALNEATFLAAQLLSPIRITELMYNPVGGDAHEYLELQNTGPTAIDLSGWTFEGINFAFPPGSAIAPGSILVLANNANSASFAARYPGVVVAGYFGGNLSNGGERIALADASGRTVVSVDYDDEGGWSTAPDGGGSSLELINLDGDPDDPANWQASTSRDGTPGIPNGTAPTPAVLINEFMAENLGAVDNSGTHPDWVELHNPGASAVNLQGWFLGDNGSPARFVFPAETTIPANGHLVVWCDSLTNATPGLHSGFALDREGDALFLHDTATQRVDAVSFGLQVGDFSAGRIGGEWRLNNPTPGTANDPATLAPQSALSINEWLANSPAGEADWIELHNRSAAHPVPLQGLHLATSNALFRITALAFLPPGGFIQLMADELPGPAHLDFKLPATGGVIVLHDALAQEIERVAYPTQTEGVSAGRLPDGGTTIQTFPGSPSPGTANYLVTYTGPLLNEVLARPDISDLAPWGLPADWIELHHSGSAPFDLSGMSLSDDPARPEKFVFPAGSVVAAGGYLRLWCESSQPRSDSFGPGMNAGFSLDGNSGGVYLFNTSRQRADAVDYGFQIAGLSIGRVGDQWRLLASPTPGASNDVPASLGDSSGLRFNEWLTDDPTGDDWFELHNSAILPVELSGLYLTDDPSLAGQARHRVAPLSFIAGNGFVKWIADGSPGKGRNHVNFSLDAFGETLRLYAPDFTLIDSIEFGLIPSGVSQGRWPDGGSDVVLFETTQSPGASNHLPPQDTDGDGMPDEWEDQFGLNQNTDDAASDLDDDGMRNLDEYLAGTEPNNPSSFLQVAIAAAGPIRLRFQAAENKSYTIEYKNALDDSAWNKLADVSDGPPRSVEISDPKGDNTRIYRLRTPQAP